MCGPQDDDDDSFAPPSMRYSSCFPDMTDFVKKCLQAIPESNMKRLCGVFKETAELEVISLCTLCSGTDGVVEAMEARAGFHVSRAPLNRPALTARVVVISNSILLVEPPRDMTSIRFWLLSRGLL